MEKLLHYTWQHRLYSLNTLFTTEGESVEVIDVGVCNRDAGPDYFNAKIRIGETLWAGNVEIHTQSSDWYAHGHEFDSAYNNVVLHVVSEMNREVFNQLGKRIPQLVLSVPDSVLNNLSVLLQADHFPACKEIIQSLPPLLSSAWITALQTERLEQKCERITNLLTHYNGDWEHVYFISLARNFGFGVNNDVFEIWSRSFPLHAAAKHRDNIFQLEALFLGTAGLLESETIQSEVTLQDCDTNYYDQLRDEYRFLAHKFDLQAIESSMWKFLRLRPQNFPYIRLVQLAGLYYQKSASFANLLLAADVKSLHACLKVGVTPYWQNHYTFGVASKHSDKRLSSSSLNLLIINTVAPLLFAYGRLTFQEQYCERALFLWEASKSEDNFITRRWSTCGIRCENAAESQALVQLHNCYCRVRKCLQCRFGYEYLQHCKWPIVKEKDD